MDPWAPLWEVNGRIWGENEVKIDVKVDKYWKMRIIKNTEKPLVFDGFLKVFLDSLVSRSWKF